MGGVGECMCCYQSVLFPPLQSTNREQLLSSILSCDVVVYSIADDINDVDEATWCAQGKLVPALIHLPPTLHPALHDQLSSFGSQKIFICISTIMTWARTKPLNIVWPSHTVALTTYPLVV